MSAPEARGTRGILEILEIPEIPEIQIPAETIIVTVDTTAIVDTREIIVAIKMKNFLSFSPIITDFPFFPKLPNVYWYLCLCLSLVSF